jgi:ParB-like chromosome segregation protein Spo0J
MQTTDIEIAKLVPPPSRPFADPAKLARIGPFDWMKYRPIEVEKHGSQFIIQSGMTRVEAARRAGITTLPAYVFTKSGAG